MPSTNIDKYVINTQVDIRSAMKKLDDSHRKILFVIQDDHSLYGSLTDGDIRRWILGGHGLDDPVDKVCHTRPITASAGYSLDDIKQKMLEHRIQTVPVLDKENHIIELLFWDAIFGSEVPIEIKENLEIPVVIMAGGRGKRLKPFTNILPKPFILSLIPARLKQLHICA